MNEECGAPTPGTTAGYVWHQRHGGIATACEPCKEARADYGRQWHTANKESSNEAGRRWYKDNKESAAAAKRRYHERNPGYKAAAERRRRYGLTEADYQQLLEQHPACAICGTPWGSTQATGPHVDHNHTTGKVRSLLCRGCNVGIGSLKESQAILRRAIAYLALHEGPDDAI